MSKDSRKTGTKSPLKMVVKSVGPPVRKKADRKKLDGFTCKECEDYYKSKNLSADELKQRLKNCSRHRAEHSPPTTPEHFWNTDFPSLDECIRRGYLKDEQKSVKRQKRQCDKKLAEELNKSDNKSVKSSTGGERVSF